MQTKGRLWLPPPMLLGENGNPSSGRDCWGWTHRLPVAHALPEAAVSGGRSEWFF